MRLFSGRINRRTFAVGFVFFVVYMATVIPYTSVIFPSSKDPSTFTFAILVEILIGFAYFYSITVRRFHDFGKKFLDKGWYWPVDMEGIVSFFIAGQNKTNKYGKPPKPKIDVKGLFGFDNTI